MGLFFSVILSLFGKGMFSVLGGRGEVLRLAVIYSNIVFAFAIALWLSNMLASILRGSGNMIGPSATMLGGAVLQISLGGALCFGWGPAPQLGIIVNPCLILDG